MKKRRRRPSPARRIVGRVAAPFRAAGGYALERFGEASSMADLATGVVNFAMAQSYGQPKLGLVCLGLSWVQVLLPDGAVSFHRARRRPRRRAPS